MKIAISTGHTHRPEWGDNRSLPETEQIIIHYRHLTGPERDRLYGMGAIPIELDTEGKMPQRISFKMDREGIVKACIVKVENLEIGDRLATAEDIVLQPELAGLYDELADLFLEENRGIEKKKRK